MLLIRSQIANMLMYLILGIIGFGGLPIALVSRNGAYWVVKRYCATMFWVFRVFCGIRVECRGEIPQGQVLICSKHMSFLDILMLSYYLPRVKFVMKRELVWAPVIGIYGWRLGCPPVARGKRGAAIEKMVKELEDDTGYSGQTVIFPQGTRVLPGATNPYRVGAGVIYSRMGQTCVPVATNVGVFWARKSPIRKPGLAVIEFLDPIEPGMDVREFVEKIEGIIEPKSNELMREAGFDV